MSSSASDDSSISAEYGSMGCAGAGCGDEDDAEVSRWATGVGRSAFDRGVFLHSVVSAAVISIVQSGLILLKGFSEQFGDILGFEEKFGIDADFTAEI